MNAQVASMTKEKTALFEQIALDSKRENHNFVSLHDVNQTKSEFMPYTTAGDIQDSIPGPPDSPERTNLIEQEAYEKGFAQGEKDGFELGEKKAVKIVEKIENILVEMTHLREAILKHHEKDILDLVFAIAEKIVHFQIGTGATIVKDAILNALELAGQKSKVVIRVNPEDYDFVENIRPELFTEYQELKSIVVTSDHSISRGGCFLETPSGDVDARIESQLELIYQSMQDTFVENE
jgi:flagellar assembly protein FliH